MSASPDAIPESPRPIARPETAATTNAPDAPTRSERLRFLLIAAATLAVIGGAVVYALVNRPRVGDEPVVPPASPSPAHASPRPSYGPPMPAGCDFDASRSPRLVLDDVPGNRLALGRCRQGEQVERRVTVRNTGGGVLCVRLVETGCACVHAHWEGDIHVQPATSGTLSIRIDSTHLEGLNEKWVTLYTNDPQQQPGTVITVSLETRLGIMLGGAPAWSAYRLAFGTRAAGRPATVALRLRSPKEEPAWTILGVESLAVPESRRSKFTWELVEAAADAPDFRCYDLKVTHPGRTELGPDTQPVRIRTSHPGRPEILVDADLTVAAKYYATPVEAKFGTVRAGDVASWKTFELRAADAGREFRVTAARIEGRGFLASEPRRIEGGWAADVRYDAATRAAGLVEAKLVFVIDDAELPEVSVPLAARAAN